MEHSHNERLRSRGRWMLVDSKEKDCVNLGFFFNEILFHTFMVVFFAIVIIIIVTIINVMIINYHCHDDDDLFVIYEEEEGVVCHKLGVDQWSSRPEPEYISS